MRDKGHEPFVGPHGAVAKGEKARAPTQAVLIRSISCSDICLRSLRALRCKAARSPLRREFETTPILPSPTCTSWTCYLKLVADLIDRPSQLKIFIRRCSTKRVGCHFAEHAVHCSIRERVLSEEIETAETDTRMLESN